MLIFDIIIKLINSLNLEILMNIYERMQTLIKVQQILLIKCISLNVNVILVSTFTEDFTQLLSQEEKRMKKKIENTYQTTYRHVGLSILI